MGYRREQDPGAVTAFRGATFDFGRGGNAPAPTGPAWYSAHPAINEWFSISGTSGGGGALLNAYSGFAVTASGVIVAAAAGGHGTGSVNNRVVSLNLMADSPTWVQRIASSASHTVGTTGYEADGKPKGRHVYHSIFSCDAVGKVILTGMRFDLEQNTGDYLDAVDTSAWAWSGAGALANVSPSGRYCNAQDSNGDLWCVSGANTTKYSVATNTWSTPSITTPGPNVRYPWALDTQRNQFFGLCWGDSEGSGTGVNACVQNGTTQKTITFNSSSAYAQFQADVPTYAGMDYDPINDRFLWLSMDHPTRVYVITPNAGTVWDMSLLILGGGSAVLPSVSYPLVKKLIYVPGLKGFICMPDATANLYFLKVA